MRLLLAQFALVLVVSLASAQDRRVFYFDGDAFEQISDRGVTVTARLNQDHGENWLTVYVVNDSNEPINLIPSNITLHQSSPTDKELRIKTEKQLARGVNRGVFWGQVLAGVGAGLSRNHSTITTSTRYGSVSTFVNTPDYEAQARWLAWADSLAARGQDIKGVTHHDYLRATTVFPGSRFAGRLCFNRDKTFKTGEARVFIGAMNYAFSFPPSSDTAAPRSAPELPQVGEVSERAPLSAPDTPEAPANTTPTSGPGILGVSGANWNQQGFAGVEIVDIMAGSAAADAGLHPGYVITDLNGKHLHSTEELAAALAENGPGSQVSIDYIFKSNLGWMPGSASVVLRNR
jgi:hypothetical protein